MVSTLFAKLDAPLAENHGYMLYAENLEDCSKDIPQKRAMMSNSLVEFKNSFLINRTLTFRCDCTPGTWKPGVGNPFRPSRRGLINRRLCNLIVSSNRTSRFFRTVELPILDGTSSSKAWSLQRSSSKYINYWLNVSSTDCRVALHHSQLRGPNVKN